MNNKYKFLSLLTIILLISVFIAGCVNYDQKTKLNGDGSGTMKIHYWSKMSNFKMGTTVGKFDFDKKNAENNYKSSNTDVKSVNVEEKLDDSTKHVTIELSFKDVNELNRAKGFETVKATWKESADGMELKYILAKDSTVSNATDNTITYEFEMPSEIVSTNGRKDGQKISWDYKLSDLGKKDIEMIANVKKPKGKTCGIFGFSIAIELVGLAYITQRNKKKSFKN
jgi:hypothetical protein